MTRGSDRDVPSLALHRAMTQTESLAESLTTIARVATDAVPGCESTGLTMDGKDGPSTIAAHGISARELDGAQYVDDLGPCLTAFREDVVVVVDRIEDTSTEWPTFARRARELDMQSSLSMPLRVDDERLGAMNMYASSEAVFSAEVVEYAQLFAAEAALAVYNAAAYWRAHRLIQNLELALESRDVIGQAKGVLMAQLGLTSEDAFDMMRAASQRLNVKVRDIAETVAQTGRLPS